MFNRTHNTTNYITNNNFFGQMSIDEMVQTVKRLGNFDQIVVRYPSEGTPHQSPETPAIEVQEAKQ